MDNFDNQLNTNPEEENESYVTLGDIFDCIKKNWIALVIITVVITILGTVYTFGIAKETYKATSTLIVEVKNDTNSSSSNINISASNTYVNTVASILTDDVCIKNAVDSYNTNNKNDSTYKKISYETFKKEISTTITSNSNYLSFVIKDTNQDRIIALSNYVMDYIVSLSNDYDETTTEDLICEIKKLTTPSSEDDVVYSSPNKPLYLIISVLIGAVVGCAFAIIKELASKKYTNKNDVEKIGFPIIGVKSFDNSKDKKNEDDDLVKPSIRAFEPYNRILTNIKLANVDNPYKAIMITSTQMGEFKTTTISNIAFAAARSGKKVVLIDLDIRKPRANKVFGVKKENGVSEYLAGTCSFEDLIKKSESGVDIITSGKSVDNPAVLFESQKLRDLINTLKETYDYVFIDTPPVLAAADSIQIVKLADGFIYNIALYKANKKDINNSITSIINNGGKLIGINITNVKMSKKESNYYYQYGYGDAKK